MLNKDIIFQNDSNNHSNDPKYILYFIASFRSHFIPRRMQAKKKLFRYPLRREACTDHTRFVWRLPKMWPKIRIFFRYLSCLCGWCVEHWTKASADQSKWSFVKQIRTVIGTMGPALLIDLKCHSEPLFVRGHKTFSESLTKKKGYFHWVRTALNVRYRFIRATSSTLCSEDLPPNSLGLWNKWLGPSTSHIGSCRVLVVECVVKNVLCK